MSKAAERRLRRMERRTLMPLSPLDQLPRAERAYVDALFASTHPESTLPSPSVELLSAASLKRVNKAINAWMLEGLAEIEQLEQEGRLRDVEL